ncbi:MAG TPA: diaminopimelate epimerase [Dermatophilaceae bacterium]|nr:diaminopimelate epimerase [Dermatophilaceae bacterium]
MAERLRFTKGHGTENDFVLVPDLEARGDVTAEQVRALADRRAGVGADGVIRVVPTSAAVEEHVRAQAGAAAWFMDYRNADGGAVEMCGNGARVFAAYLRREGLESADEFAIATRGGIKLVRFEGDLIAVNMGDWRLVDSNAAAGRGFDAMVKVRDHDPFPGLRLDLGNPHVVVALPDTADLAGLDLGAVPELNPVAPQGSNVEFVRPLGPGHIQMRVHERGVGETRSCGTGAAAAALATRYWAQGAQDDTSWRVDVPGGTLRVRPLPGQQVELAGPAVLVFDGELLA